MGLNIYAPFQCNAIGFLSNKGEKQQKTTLNKSKIAYRDTGNNIIVLKPSIDRIVFSFSPSQDFINQYDPTENLEAYQKKIHDWVFADAAADENNHLSFVKGVSFKKQPYASYNINVNFQPPGAKEPILIHIDPKKPELKKPFIRIDMKPDHLNDKAMQAFRRFIRDLLIMPGGTPSYAEFLAQTVISHLEINVDMLGVRSYDLEVINYSKKGAVPAKSIKYKSPTGRTQTTYPKIKKSGGSDMVYDKRIEQLENGKEPIYGDILHSRFEARIQKKTSFDSLNKIQNRCAKVRIRALDLKKFSKLPYTHKIFVRLAMEQSLDKALELIPPNAQPKFLKMYNGVMLDIWKPVEFWGYWKNEIAKHPLLQPK